ncbi:MAG: undecaprenyl/decaprenyl-phosphate alpha-N-acetylglucosaminyl 1-phosphate transferase, partial [Desulfobacteraceae bacterium]|nr:undecaprenyl/decaprenyl-phosphate alpha-N-acetylglucosaminyl 1-phosphate transferase [Desulfobacteraceae bacterium]
MDVFTVFILSFFLTIALVPVFKRVAFRMNIVDVPNARKVHLLPMPKTGGISMAIGAFVPMILWVSHNNFVNSVLVGAAIIVVFGIVDDINPLSAKHKILPQTAAALIVILFGNVRITCLGELTAYTGTLPWFISVPLTLVVILGITNAINLSDGLDGLAGGISILSFIMIVFLAYQSGNLEVAVMAMAVVGGIAGFLRYNTHPAVLFMGDAGSQLLGFLSIVFAIVLTQSNTPYSKILSLTIIGFPILDTLTVMIERIIKKRSPFQADKNHFHHRLLRFGFYHTESVLIIYIIQACFIAYALMFRFYSDWVHVAGFLALSLCILCSIFFAMAHDWKLSRGNSFFDVNVKKRLRLLKEQHISILASFGVIKFAFSFILFFQILTPANIPPHLSLIALCLMALVAAAYCFNLSHIKEHIL